ncbi:hypothetical protein GCM10022395_15420 [Snuella lapsa]|uniref:Uncharacterized protein n=1 Tax=Snuella lapsa TaxID=870481 RepID=A0ABP6XGG9_9FLAO
MTKNRNPAKKYLFDDNSLKEDLLIVLSLIICTIAATINNAKAIELTAKPKKNDIASIVEAYKKILSTILGI